jgi:hypothetical protein
MYPQNLYIDNYNSTWENNIKIDLNKMECEDMDLFPIAEDKGECQAFVSTMRNTWDP